MNNSVKTITFEDYTAWKKTHAKVEDKGNKLTFAKNDTSVDTFLVQILLN